MCVSVGACVFLVKLMPGNSFVRLVPAAFFHERDSHSCDKNWVGRAFVGSDGMSLASRPCRKLQCVLAQCFGPMLLAGSVSARGLIKLLQHGQGSEPRRPNRQCID